MIMLTGIQDEQVETVYHKCVNLHYRPVSAKLLHSLKINITDEWGESINFQHGKFAHFR